MSADFTTTAAARVHNQAILLESSQLRDLLGGPSEMFRFFRGDPERTGRLIDIGLFPWWTDPDLKGEFLQTLTVLTHRLDYALWPDSPALMHAHSLLWLGAAVAVTAAFPVRRVPGISLTALALLPRRWFRAIYPTRRRSGDNDSLRVEGAPVPPLRKPSESRVNFPPLLGGAALNLGRRGFTAGRVLHAIP